MSTPVMIISALIYFGLVLFLGYRASRNETREDFLIGSRAFGVWPITMSLASTWATVGWVTFIIGLTIADPLGYWPTGIGISLGLIVMTILAPRLRDYAAEHNIHSLPDFVWHTQAPYTGYLMAIINFTVYMGWLLMELVATGGILSEMTDLSYELSIVVIIGVIGAYLLMGGFKALIGTDVVQFLFIAIFIGVLYFVIDFSQPNISLSEAFETTNLSSKSLFTGIFIIFPAIVYGSEVWQRIIACNSPKAARQSMFHTIWTQWVLYLPFIVLPLFVVGYDGESAEGFWAYFIESQMPGFLQPLVFVVMLAMIMSTIDSICFIAGQTLINDGVAHFLSDEKQEKQRALLKFGIGFVMLLALFLAMFFKSYIDVLYFVMAIWVVMGPLFYPLVMEKPPSHMAIFVTMLLGVIVILGLYAAGIYEEKYGVTVFFASLVLPFILDLVGFRKLSQTTQ